MKIPNFSVSNYGLAGLIILFIPHVLSLYPEGPFYEKPTSG